MYSESGLGRLLQISGFFETVESSPKGGKVLRYLSPLPLAVSWLSLALALESLALVYELRIVGLSLHLCVLRILVDAYRKFSRLIPLSGARVSRLAEPVASSPRLRLLNRFIMYG